jgi:hypothetical protein
MVLFGHYLVPNFDLIYIDCILLGFSNPPFPASYLTLQYIARVLFGYFLVPKFCHLYTDYLDSLLFPDFWFQNSVL